MPTLTREAVLVFLDDFEQLAAQERFALLQDKVHADAVFRFSDGDFVGRAAVQQAFESTWRSGATVQDKRFWLSDIQVLTLDTHSASATYSWHWQGRQNGQLFQIDGRGTRVLVLQGGQLQILHEHLSRQPKA